MTMTNYALYFSCCLWLIAFVCFAFSGSATAQEADADHNGLIEIDSLEKLFNIRYNLAGTSYRSSPTAPEDASGCPAGVCNGYELAADLDFDSENDGHNEGDAYWNSGSGWAPIASPSDPFVAIFEGNNHTISNLFIERESRDDVGLFGAIQGGQIRHLNLINAYVKGDDHVGSLVGRQDGGEIIGSYAEATVSGDSNIGGLVGRVIGESASITTSSVTATVSGGNEVGGLAGDFSGIIASSYAIATVSGHDEIGGLVGDFSGTIASSYAMATISGHDDVGGLVGDFGGAAASMTSSYAVATVSGEDNIGGLAGDFSGTMESSYAVATVSGTDDNIGGLAGDFTGTMASSSAMAMVSGDDNVGGLAGDFSGTMESSSATATVSGNYNVGGLAGDLRGTVESSYAIATVSGDEDVGGLAGEFYGTMTASYAAATVSGHLEVGGLVGDFNGRTSFMTASYAAATVSGHLEVGGLVGDFNGTMALSYAMATVSGDGADSASIGGLVGYLAGTVTSSYAVATVSGDSTVGGLVGESEGDITATYAVAAVSGNQAVGGLVGISERLVKTSYFNTDVTAQTHSDQGKTTSGLQTPVDYTGIYALWNVDLDDDEFGDNSWDFGSEAQYPGLALPPLSANSCPSVISANVTIVEDTARKLCIHRPASLSITGFSLLADDDSGSSATDHITNVSSPRIVGRIDLPENSLVRIVARPTTAALAFNVVSETLTDENGDFTAMVDLTKEGSNIFEAFARRPTDTEYMGLLGVLEITRDTELPSLFINRSETRLTAHTEDAHPDFIKYDVLTGGAECTVNFDAATRYTGEITPMNAADEYCFIATDLADNTTALSSLEAGSFADIDGDGLLEIDSLADLHNVRYNLAGTAFETSMDDPDPDNSGCPDTGCYGYELTADLDFDANGDESVDENDPYWNDGAGWEPIGGEMTATFEGNNHTIANLFIDRSNASGVGLFDEVASSGVIRNLGLVGANVTGRDSVGSLAGESDGEIIASYATANVTGTNIYVGGLVGRLFDSGKITASYAFGVVTGENSHVGGLAGRSLGEIAMSYAASTVRGTAEVGGLVGSLAQTSDITGRVTMSYAVGTVTGEGDYVGGLVGNNIGGIIAASYAAVAPVGDGQYVTGASNVGGLVGRNTNSIWATGSIAASYVIGPVSGNGNVGSLAGSNDGSIVASYFDVIVGLSDAEQGKSSHELQQPTAYGDDGIYSTWNDADLDGNGVADAPWDFGDGTQYPGLILPQLPSGNCPPALSPDVLVQRESGSNQCVHRPVPVLAGSLALLAADGARRSAAGFVTNLENVRLTGLVTLQDNRDIRIVSAPGGDTVAEVLYDNTAASTNVFTTEAIMLTEGSNQLELFARRSGAAEYVGPFDELTVTLDAQAPSLFVSRSEDGHLVGAYMEDDVQPDFIEYGVLTSGVASDCTTDFAVDTRYADVFAAANAATEYCFIATDLAGNTTALSTVGAPNRADLDGDGLIEISSLEDLNNVRHNLAGTSLKTAADDADPDSSGCPTDVRPYDPDNNPDTDNSFTACYGYELVADLNFDANGNGRADAGDDYWNDGVGWTPIGTESGAFAAVFEGNRHTIENLFINRGVVFNLDHTGLFGNVSGEIRNLGLINANVTVADARGNSFVGSLVGRLASNGRVTASYAETTVTVIQNHRSNDVGGLVGRTVGGSFVTQSYAVATVSSGNSNGGGLIGRSYGAVTSSYAAARVESDFIGGGLIGSLENTGRVILSYAAATVSSGNTDDADAGGLVGRFNGGDISANYAVAKVSGSGGVGGLVGGFNSGVIVASYALATVSGDGDVGGLVGKTQSPNISFSYFDADLAGLSHAEQGKTTSELQTPTTYGDDSGSSIYKDWDNADYDGDGSGGDMPWDFGSNIQYPGLIVPRISDSCPPQTSANIAIEAMEDECIHRPALSVVEFDLVDDSGSSATDNITNVSNPMVAVATTLPLASAVRIVSQATLAPVSEERSVDLHGNLTVSVNLIEGINILTAVARRLDETEFAELFGTLEITLDTEAPSLLVSRTRDGARVSVSTEDAHPDILMYDELPSGLAADCTTDFPAATPYTGIFAATVGREYCVVATDLAGNKAALSTADAPGFVDVDGNGLMEIDSLEDLNNIRYNLAGTSYKTSEEDADLNSGGCPTGGCNGYELTANLDFDPDGNGPDADDPYWNGGSGWAPIGTANSSFAAIFEGNGHTLSNLFIHRNITASGATGHTGLFGDVSGEIRNLGLIDANVTVDDARSNSRIGSLVGHLAAGGRVTASYAHTTVTAIQSVIINDIGGLVGRVAGGGLVTRSYAVATVSSANSPGGGLAGRVIGALAESYAVATVDSDFFGGGLAGVVESAGKVTQSYAVATVAAGRDDAEDDGGGLVGRVFGNVTASYAIATVSGRGGVGGLVGHLFDAGDIVASYAVGGVSGDGSVGGLVGNVTSGGDIAASYFDKILGLSDPEQGKSSSDLQTPVGYEEIYSTWNDADLDDDGGTVDEPWSFGETTQYPGLVFSKLSSEDCPNAASADIVIEEPADTECVHRPVPLLATGFDLVAADDAGPSSTDRVTNKTTVSFIGQVTLPSDRDFRIVSVPDGTELAELLYDSGTSVSTNTFTMEATLSEGLNQLEIFTRRSGEEYAESFGELTVTLDVTLPTLELRRSENGKVYALAEDINLDALMYGELASGRAEDCTIGFSAPTPYTGIFTAANAATEYCFIATDLAGNTTALSTVGAPNFADGDGDGLLDIYTLDDLNNVRHNLAGTSYQTSADDADSDMLGCPTMDNPYNPGGGADPIVGCYGYELMVDLNFDPENDGHNSGDPYWHGGEGWPPIGTESSSFTGVFEGNHHTISNLLINRNFAAAGNHSGLFGDVSGEIRNLGLIDANVTVNTVQNGSYAGSLTGRLAPNGKIIASYAKATVRVNNSIAENDVGGLVGRAAANSLVTRSSAVATVFSDDGSGGGLVGRALGEITESYAVAEITSDFVGGGLVGVLQAGRVTQSYAVATVAAGRDGDGDGGGLVGRAFGNITASYAIAKVSGGGGIGGLVGDLFDGGSIAASYAVATVSGNGRVGGLVGNQSGNIADSYFDTIMGLGDAEQGKSSDDLQTQTVYDGIYSTWNDADLDGDSATTDEPWHFGEMAQYPALVLSQPVSGRCPTVASAYLDSVDILVESTGDGQCIHRPFPLLIGRLGLAAENDIGSFKADLITSLARIRLTGRITLPVERDILVRSEPDESVVELSYDGIPAHTFTVTVELTEGVNQLDVNARRSGEAYADLPLDQLQVILDTRPPNVKLSRRSDGSVAAILSEAHIASFRYGELGADENCDTDFATTQDYVSNTPLPPGAIYCFVAVDLVGHKTAVTSAILRMRLRVFLEGALP